MTSFAMRLRKDHDDGDEERDRHHRHDNEFQNQRPRTGRRCVIFGEETTLAVGISFRVQIFA